MTEHLMTIDSPVGPLTVGVDDDGAVRRIEFFKRAPTTTGSGPDLEPCQAAQRGLLAVRRELEEYFAGTRQAFTLRTAPRGTDFQLSVWRELERIPYGDTISYGELAHRIGKPKAVRAVGAANGANPIPIVIPCHRVIGSSGKLVGYGGGLDNKDLLLSIERRIR